MTDHDERMRRRYQAAASNLLVAIEEAEQHPSPRTRPPSSRKLPTWDPRPWGGLTEEQAFEEQPLAVVSERGRDIASVTWRQGSWANAWEYRGRFFVSDEVEFTECASAAEALQRAGVDRDCYDAIESQWVDPAYEHLLERDD